MFRQRVQKDAFLDLAEEMNAVEDVAEKVVHLNAHRCVVVVQVRRSQHLLRVADLNAQ